MSAARFVIGWVRSVIAAEPAKVTVDRLKRLALLDVTVFEEVRDDEKDLRQALIVAGASCLLAGFGAWLRWEVSAVTPPDAFVNGFLLGSLFLAIMYSAAVLIIYVIMVQFFQVQVDLLALGRTMGYAAAPLALSAAMFIPVLYPLFALLPLTLTLVGMVYAAQTVTGQEVDSVRVMMACLIGFGVMVLVLGVVAISSSSPSAPIGAGQFGLFYDF